MANPSGLPELNSCEWGYPTPCGRAAAYVGRVRKYPENLYACEEHRIALFGNLAVNTAMLPNIKYEDYRRLADGFGSYSPAPKQSTN